MPQASGAYMKHRLTRLVLLAVLAGGCAAVLYTRVYVHFERVRIVAVAAEQSPVGGVLAVALPDLSMLVGRPTSIVLRIENASRTPRVFSVRVNGGAVSRVVVARERTARADLSLPAGVTQGSGNVLELQSEGDAWALHLLEVGNAHGFSHGLFSFVVAPVGTRRHAAVSVGAVEALAVWGGLWLLSVPWFRPVRVAALRATHATTGLAVGLVFLAVLVLPAVSGYEVLLSAQAFWICIGLLYVPVFSEIFDRYWRASVAGVRGAGRFAVSHRLKALYLAIVGVFLVSVAGFYDEATGFTSLIRFGSARDASALSALRTVPHAVDGEWGYDGQYYAQLALDPLARDPAIEGALDTFAYRARRILFSWTAFGLGFGQPRWILQAYALQNVLCWLILAVLLLRWCPPTNLKNAFAWFACLFSRGLIASVEGALLEGPSLLLVVLAIIAIEKEKRWLAAGIVGLSGLARETNILAGASLAGRWPRTWQAARVPGARAVIVSLPLVVWLTFLLVSHPALFIQHGGKGNLAAPLSGYLGSLQVTLSALRQDGWASYATLDLLTLVSVTVQAVFLAARRQWQSPWYRVGIAYAILMLVLGPAVWESSRAFTRVLLPMTVAFNVLLPRGRAYWPLAILGNLALIHGLEAMGVLARWPYL